jgi:hypothetical protein
MNYIIFQQVSTPRLSRRAFLNLRLDEVEYSRLDKQHLVHLLANDGLIARGAIDRVRMMLSANNPTADGSPRRVLDLGE